jgi:uncharacterized membrane protein (Fun14 family)
MSDESQSRASTPKTTGPAGAGFREAWRGRAAWQRAAAVASLLVTLVSGVLIAVGPDSGATSTGAGSEPATAPLDDPTALDAPRSLTPGLSSGLWEGPLPPLAVPGEDDQEPTAGETPGEPAGVDESTPDGVIWSPALFKTGFSFFMGFALAFAVRSFVRISLVAIGLMGLLLFGLEYMGLVTVEWGVMADRWDGLLAWLRPQLTSFQGFITGQLPSAAAATAGLVTGWRRG